MLCPQLLLCALQGGLKAAAWRQPAKRSMGTIEVRKPSYVCTGMYVCTYLVCMYVCMYDVCIYISTETVSSYLVLPSRQVDLLSVSPVFLILY